VQCGEAEIYHREDRDPGLWTTGGDPVDSIRRTGETLTTDTDGAGFDFGAHVAEAVQDRPDTFEAKMEDKELLEGVKSGKLMLTRARIEALLRMRRARKKKALSIAVCWPRGGTL
jgi:hypothetical protein